MIISIALLLDPGLGLALTKCKQWWSLCFSHELLIQLPPHLLPQIVPKSSKDSFSRFWEASSRRTRL